MVLLKLRMNFNACKLTHFIRRVGEVQRQKREIWVKVDKCKALVYGYKTRRILERENMQELKTKILMRKKELELLQKKQKASKVSLVGDIEESNSEMRYLINRYIDYFNKYLYRGFNYEEPYGRSSQKPSPERLKGRLNLAWGSQKNSYCMPGTNMSPSKQLNFSPARDSPYSRNRGPNLDRSGDRRHPILEVEVERDDCDPSRYISPERMAESM